MAYPPATARLTTSARWEYHPQSLKPATLAAIAISDDCLLAGDPLSDAEKRLRPDSSPKDPALRGNKLAKWGLGCSMSVAVVVLALFIILVIILVRLGDIRKTFLLNQASEVIEASSLSEAERTTALDTISRFVEAVVEGTVDKEAFQESRQILTNCFCIVRLRSALQESDLSAADSRRLLDKVGRLYAAISEGMLTEEDCEQLMTALPNRRGVMKPPPWSGEETAQLEAGLDLLLQGRHIQTGTDAPDFARTIRVLIENMDAELKAAPTHHRGSVRPRRAIPGSCACRSRRKDVQTACRSAS